ncbi:MAG: ribosome-binding factor A, partial [Alphaproteobacteria bacterium]|nr:ribosome-binding factor A [Alphaproteobacteria bacterium]
LRSAIVYFTPLGGLKKEETAKFFELQRHYFKDLIAKKMKMRFIPELNFKLDTSFEYSERIDNLLHNVSSKL